MHLTQVHMENFKSFGRKLTVPFEPGFTGITGPNGSGKSNIGDAILFVLGPNSPRAIRAGRLTDLIFNGGAAGKPANYTLVSLTFENEDRVMPIDADEVTLTRKVKRMPKKGDKDAYSSYFYVNGRASKKREFVDLLNHARISADGYNITQQGDVLEICKMTPAQRRGILDDIAGVTTFDKDINAANKKKEGVEDNLERIGIILDEIEQSLRRLDKEKGAAQRYKELHDTIGETKAQMAWRRKADLEDQIAQVQQQIEKYTADRAKLEEDQKGLKEKYKDAQARFAELEQQIRAEGGEEVEKIQNQVQEARDRMVRLEEKIHFAKDELAAGDEDLLPLKQELARIDKELARTRKVESDAETAHAEAATELAEKRKELEQLRDQASRSDKGAMAINKELGTLKKEHEDKRIELHDLRLLSDRADEKQASLERRLGEARSESEAVATDLKEATWELEELKKESDGSGKKQKELERRSMELRKAQAEFAQQQEDLEHRIRRLQRELHDLQAAEAAAARAGGGAPRAVDEILKARDDGSIKGIVGTISELAGADDEYQTALETAAGANMVAVVVEDDSVAAACIEMLKQSRAGRAKLLPLNKMVPGRPRGQALMKAKKDGCLGFAIDLIDFNPRYQNAFWHVFGDTLVATNMDAGRRLMGGVRLVTRDGELFEAGGAMVGGARGKKKAASFSGSDRGRIDEVLQKIAQAEAAQEQAIEGITRVRQELGGLEEELTKFGRSGVNTDDRRKELERRVAAAQEKARSLESAVTDLEKEQQAAVDEEADRKDRVEALEKRLAELETLREEKSQLLLKGTKKEVKERIESLDASVRGLTETVLKAENRKDVAAKQAELVQDRRNEVRRNIDGSGTDREKYESDVKRYTEGLKKAEAELKALNEMERKATAQLGGLRDKKDMTYEELVGLKAKMDKLADRMETQYGLIMNAKTKLPGLEESLGEALIELKEHPIEVADPGALPGFDELRKKLRDLERRLDNLGPVNMRALEEYEEQAGRKADLDAEVERLKAQREELDRLVAEITEKKKGVFMEVFEAVDKNFAEVYAGLSMDGKALMELENPQDPFEGGLILKAQPMGKRVTRLDALSGGEKSLTSMAFIFAIQRFDPSPFYYFDEVDQNLDAVNSELLAKMIRQNAKFAQFIVVSLRKITLKEADFLYGVTQQVPGQSEMIANFDLKDVKDEEPKDDEGGDEAAHTNGADDGKGLSDAIQGMIEVKVTE